MFAIIENLKIHYKWGGKKDEKRGPILIMLHGWGQSMQCFKKMVYNLPNYRYLLIDLPGFGLSQIPTLPVSSNDYARLISKLLGELKIENGIAIGHSFGGKIACILASMTSIKKMVLIGSSGIILPKPLRISFRIWLSRLLKPWRKFLPPKWIPKGSRDYEQAQGIMRQILVKSVNQSISDLLPKLNLPVLLIWGTEDRETPTANYFQQLLPQARLVMLKGGHFVFLEAEASFYEQIEAFI